MKCYQEYIIKSTTKTAYNSIYYKRKTNACFDNILLWIIVIIKTCDNHYYDEDNIEIGKATNCQVMVNHIVELTEEEKAEARQEAIKQYQREELAKIQSRNARVKKTENIATQVQPSLFDF